MLSIVKYIKENGLAKAIETFKLKTRVYEKKILIKYDQIESPMGVSEVQDCRGLILERETWTVMCHSFRKFFNSGEGHAATIDWNTARILEKLDGTMIQVYFDWHKQEWFAATTGTGEGEGEVNNKLGTTFNELFWETINRYYFDRSMLHTNFTYVFELTTPYNIVVKPHGESSCTLLTIRNNKTLEELGYDEVVRTAKMLHVPVVKAFDLNAKDVVSLAKTLENMPWSEEGYVVVDECFNRIKIKNPAYVAVHHLKSKTGEHNILTVVKANEIEEFAATFPERRDEIFKLKANYDNLLLNLNNVWDELKPHLPNDDSASGRKAYAMEVFKIVKDRKVDSSFTSLFFALQTGKVGTVREYMYEYDDKKLYKML